MNPTQRRKSTLGRRNRNGENLEKFSFSSLARQLVTPSKSGRGRLGAGAKLKASNEFMLRKQLQFSNFSSGKKTKLGSSFRATYRSPNDSQASYQSDNSLNLTDVQSKKIPSPDYNSAMTNPTVTKAYQGYKSMGPSTSAAAPLSPLMKPTTWDAMNLKPPSSPPPSRYNHLIQLELASIKPPVDPDDLINLENLTLAENSDSRRTYLKPITSTVTKEVDVSKFSPHLSSTCVNSTFMLSSEKDEKCTTNVSNAVQTQGKVEIPNPTMFNNGNKHCFDNKNKPYCARDKICLNLESKTNFNQNNNVAHCTSKSPDLSSNCHDKQNLNNESRDHKQSLNADVKSYTSKTSKNPVSRNLCFDQFQFTKPLELSKSQSSSSSLKYFETSRGTKLCSKNLDSTLSCELNHGLKISNALPATKCSTTFDEDKTNVTLKSMEDSNSLLSAKKPSASDRKLTAINEVIENDLSCEDLNSTDSFLIAEQTIIDQDQYTEPQTKNKSSITIVNNNHSIPELNKTLNCEDEITQAMVTVDKVINNMVRLRSEMNECENELKNVKKNLLQLKLKQSKSKDKGTQNKENIPTTETKPIRNKWFNEIKSENPNLLKTPNPARQSVSRMSLANQSIMTPHSLSVVISDQLDDIFN